MNDEPVTREDLKRMGPEAIRDALRSGELDHLLGKETPAALKPPELDPKAVEQAAANGTLDRLLEEHRAWQPSLRERLPHMSPEEIRESLDSGEADSLLRGEE